PDHPPAPPDNPTTPEKARLGERLFHDPALSANRKIACASCHDVAKGAGDDSRPTAIGVTGVAGRRNTPTVFGAAFQARLFWDGRASSLEEQALGPLLNPDEMGMPSPAAVEDRVRADPTYRDAFDRAFGPGAPITIEAIARAIAAYQRGLVINDTPYDRFVAGDVGALNDAQKRGMATFEAVGCANCHSGPNFSGASLIGPRSPYGALLAGRSERGARHDLAADKGRADAAARDGIWRIPSLRNVALTAPYFHNGSVAGLDEAVRVMAETQLDAVIGPSQRGQPWWSPETASFSRFERIVLSERDVEDIAAFLRALSSDRLAGKRAILGEVARRGG
ncbi:MAG: c-type cytochrome, partial [Alphaproteobacteria bacterium]|nr:c-type cytochrome [Alphaproteobacteria bacterium]